MQQTPQIPKVPCHEQSATCPRHYWNNALVLRFAFEYQKREPPLINATEAFDAITQKLGPDAAAAVRTVDIRANALSVDVSHPDATRVRDFLTTFDHLQPQVIVKAVMKRRVEATPGTPAHEEIVSRPTLFGRPGHPIRFSIPGENKDTTVEFEITCLPGEQ